MSKPVAPSYLHSSNPRVPAADFPFRHCLPVQIRFSDIDMLGHINNNVYLTFMDLAKIDYFCTAAGAPVTARDLCMVVAHIDCDFLSPSYMTDKLEVWTRVVAIGERSLRLEQRIVDSISGEIRCIARTVMAGFDPKALAPIAIPARWVDITEKFEQHPLVNHPK